MNGTLNMDGNAMPVIDHPALKRRPRTLEEVAQWSEDLGRIDEFIREFLDEFYLEPKATQRAAMIAGQPRLSGDIRRDAYLAAVAEHLAFRYGLTVPTWTDEPSRFLKRPYFPAGLESLKAILLVESPVAFRRRLIFVGSDPLSRPRRPHETR